VVRTLFGTSQFCIFNHRRGSRNLFAANGKNAVRVEIRGKRVGYLSPEAAIQYRRQLIARGKPNANGQCQAVIKGGGSVLMEEKGLIVYGSIFRAFTNRIIGQ
jgi:hypothetical protein